MSQLPLLVFAVLGTGCSWFGRGPIDTDAVVVGIDPSAFDGALSVPARIEPCTLSGGTKTTCHVLTITGSPKTHAIGPFCPRNAESAADDVGVWLAKGEVHDLTGPFVSNLATFYDDPTWALVDPVTKKVRVTDSLTACRAAARPDVDPAYQNHCVECELADLGGPQPVTIRVPTTPVKRTRSASVDGHGKVGVSLEGVVFDPPAPIDHILAAHTIAAFDDCGGHVNPHVGYHYHAATGCSRTVDQADGHAGLLGVALDGFGLYALADAGGKLPQDLDACRGHEDPTRGYHYHVAPPAENRFIGCFMGELGTVETNE